jgi:PAS domain S-box-containing protein
VALRSDGWRQLFETVFERSSNPMSVITGDRVIRRANEAKARVLKRPVDELVGHRVEEFVAPEQREDAIRDWTHAAEHGETLVGEYDLIGGDGSRVPVRWAAEPVHMDGESLFICTELPDTADDALTASDDADADELLTKREREIVHLLALGGTGPDIAAELVVSHDTVRTHIRNAMGKTGARTRAALVAIAMGEELL